MSVAYPDGVTVQTLAGPQWAVGCEVCDTWTPGYSMRASAEIAAMTHEHRPNLTCSCGHKIGRHYHDGYGNRGVCRDTTCRCLAYDGDRLPR